MGIHIDNYQRVILLGKEKTLFDVFEERAEGYHYVGTFSVDGHDAARDACAAVYWEQIGGA